MAAKGAISSFLCFLLILFLMCLIFLTSSSSFPPQLIAFKGASAPAKSNEAGAAKQPGKLHQKMMIIILVTNV